MRDGAFLLVQGANPPDAGLWDFPGGKIGSGESRGGASGTGRETAIRAEAVEILPSLDAPDKAVDEEVRHHFSSSPSCAGFKWNACRRR
jgi:8-oxo-dGTP diphosphatase